MILNATHTVGDCSNSYSLQCFAKQNIMLRNNMLLQIDKISSIYIYIYITMEPELIIIILYWIYRINCI